MSYNNKMSSSKTGKEIDQQVNSIHILGGSNINEEKPSQTQKAMDLKVNGGTMIKKSLVVLGNIYGNTIKPKNPEGEITIEGNVTVTGTLTTNEPTPLVGNITTSLIEEEIPNQGITINGNVTINGTLTTEDIYEVTYKITATEALTITNVTGIKILDAPPTGYYYYFENAAVEYVYDGSNPWTQAKTLKFTDAGNTSPFAYQVSLYSSGSASRISGIAPDQFGQGDVITNTAVWAFSYSAGNAWTVAAGATFTRIRFRYRLYPLI